MFKKLINLLHKKDELIGIWTNEDDGSGLINFYGWSLEFFENGKGKSWFWNTDSDLEGNSYDFEWKRIGEVIIKLRIENKDWETITYEIQKYTGAYNSKYLRLKEVNKDSFWSSHEPLYKRR